MPQASKSAERQNWEWNLQDVTLAEKHGLTRERVRQIRRELGRDDSYNKRRKRKAVSCGGIVV